MKNGSDDLPPGDAVADADARWLRSAGMAGNLPNTRGLNARTSLMSKLS